MRPEITRRFWARVLIGSLASMLFSTQALAQPEQDIGVLRSRILAGMIGRPGEKEVPAIEDCLSRQRPDGSFSDLNYGDTSLNDSWQPAWHLKRIRTFATAYVSPGNPYFHGENARQASLLGVRYWLAKDYRNKNWFWNEIGVPEVLTDISLVFWNDYTPDERAKALDIIKRAKLGNTSANLVWLAQIVLRRGLLENDPGTVKSALDKIVQAIAVAPKQENGPQIDHSYLFHGPLLYSFGYGIAYYRDNVGNALLTSGTGFAFPKDRMGLVRDDVLDGSQWFTRGVGADLGANGRGITRKEYNAYVLVGLGKNLAELGIGREQEASEMAARAAGDPHAPPLVGNRQFWRADVMAHHRAAYYASARMYSTRTKNTEWGNGEALQNFYMADGANFLMQDGKEYFNIAPIWDWQRVPGTTVELLPGFGPVANRQRDPAPDAFVPSRNGIIRKTTESFVGGASNGMFGVFGGRFSRETLSLNKAWIFFDSEYVCLGSNLNCASDNPVVTTLNQCYLRGDVRIRAASGPRMLTEGVHDEPAMLWALHDKVGYVFSQPAHAQVVNDLQKGSWSRVTTEYPNDPPVSGKVFKSWIEHGARPTNSSYVYTVVPDTAEVALESYAKDPPTVVVANNETAQAVWQKKLQRGGAIYYAPGVLEFRPGFQVRSDQAIALLVSETPGTVELSVANPQNQPLSVHMAVDRDGKSVPIDIDLPDGPRAGSTVTRKVSF